MKAAEALESGNQVACDSMMADIADDGIPIEIVAKAVSSAQNDLDKQTDDEKIEYNKSYAEKADEYISAIEKTSYYKSATASEKASIISEAKKYANAVVKGNLTEKYIEWQELEKNGFDIGEIISFDVLDKDTDNSGSESKDEYAEAVKNSYFSDREKELLIGLNEASSYNDYVAKKTGAWAVGKWYKKVSGKYIEITDSNEFFEMRKKGTTTYQYTGKKTDEIDELWKAYRGY